jgi:RNA polymerase sigma-B factor
MLHEWHQTGVPVGGACRSRRRPVNSAETCERIHPPRRPAPIEMINYAERGSGGREERAADGDEFSEFAAPLAEYAAMDPDDPRRCQLRDRLVAGYLPLAQRIARRFGNRGEPLDDLVQVATLGLIQALGRFRPEYGNDFLAFAVPTITGEVRRHFRDQGWGMRVPRRLKDLHVAMTAAVSGLSQELGHSPRPSEIAARLDVPVEEVLEGLEAGHAYRAASLDATLDGAEGSEALSDVLGEPDGDLELVDYRESLQPILAELPARERTILMMRFYASMTQTQIAERVGISQMHVSRILGATLDQLRRRLLND